MENEVKNSGFIRQNKKLEYCLIGIGMALFVAVGARGLQKIDDRAVAAGEANKNAFVDVDSSFVNSVTGQSFTLTPAELEQQQKAQNAHNADQSAPEKNKLPGAPQPNEHSQSELGRTRAVQKSVKQAE